MYQIICTRHKLHSNNGNKNPVFPVYIHIYEYICMCVCVCMYETADRDPTTTEICDNNGNIAKASYITLIIKKHSDWSDGILHIKMFMQVYSVEWVFKIKPNLSNVFDAIYGDLCFQLAHFFCDDCKNMCTWFCHHPTLNISHTPLFKVSSERTVGAVCLIMTLLVWHNFATNWIDVCMQSKEVNFYHNVCI